MMAPWPVLPALRVVPSRTNAGRWLVVRPLPGLPEGIGYSVIADCATQAGAERARAWHEISQTSTPEPTAT